MTTWAGTMMGGVQVRVQTHFLGREGPGWEYCSNWHNCFSGNVRKLRDITVCVEEVLTEIWLQERDTLNEHSTLPVTHTQYSLQGGSKYKKKLKDIIKVYPAKILKTFEEKRKLENSLMDQLSPLCIFCIFMFSQDSGQKNIHQILELLAHLKKS